MATIDERLAQLRDESQTIEHELSAMQLHPRFSVTASDTSGYVTVRWIGDDLTLEVTNGWERVLPAEELTAAASEAMTAALHQRYDESTIREGDERPEVPAPSPPELDLTSWSRSPEFAAAIRRPEFAERLPALIDEVARRAARRSAAGGPAQIVSVALSHEGTVTSWRLDAEHAHGRSGDVITRDAAAAVAASRAILTDPTARPLTAHEAIEVLNA